MESTYKEPTALIVLSGIFLALGAVFALITIVDMIWRQGWKSMMWIMIPVYPINAAYMGPLTLYLYFRYGRPSKPEKRNHVADTGKQAKDIDAELKDASDDVESGMAHHGGHNHHDEHHMALEEQMHSDHDAHAGHNMHSHMHGPSADRPMWATVLIGVSHCGAGCVLGDLVGEWLVFGTGATINGADIWPCLLIDYAFALLFGIIFQYFSIAPMSGEYGPKTLWRAAKADFLSLTFFEIGLFGWMVAYQVGIWDYRLEMNTWTYWWMMQVGMILGFVTATPINWWLITKNIKEPCA
ncbi:hypothetical protein NA57DRAFT_35704 [Rhizodiscina lignyota]|uniref:DUF4396 domain-containing protein n=1 Tax=Rhizodiscina lignyota TaxID=1504668 RepID=A0A9P4M922_9PEZI|nr:hypothetical protein NA57DRAFT_35704 [Rhizodiscina lignyota]